MPPVRISATKALGDVLGRGARPKDAIEAHAKGLDSVQRDRAFMVELVYGSLRHKLSLEWALSRYLKQPEGLPQSTSLNLLIAAYQILHLRVPDWAAVNEAVEAERSHGGLVNAVLRKLVSERDAVLSELERMRRNISDGTLTGDALIQAMSTVTSHPAWLVRRWQARFGVSDAMALLDANNAIPPLTLRVNALRATRDEVLSRLAAMGIGAEPTRISPVGIKLSGTIPFSELAPLSGLVMAQDEAAQIASLMLSPRPGNRVLDACAAPGGKTCHMAELMRGEGHLMAVEQDPARAKVLIRNIAAMGHTIIKPAVGDIRADGPWRADAPYDAVMVDAPCSSLGVLRRNPDIKARRTESELAAYAARQASILDAAALLVRPGGRLLYCTCSTEPEEGEHTTASFLQRQADFIIIEAPAFEGGFFADGAFRSYPHRDAMDGFYAAGFQRRG